MDTPVCVVPNCKYVKQILAKPSSLTGGKYKYMKTCCKHGVADIPVKKD